MAFSSCGRIVAAKDDDPEQPASTHDGQKTAARIAPGRIVITPRVEAQFAQVV
jgi:hypothetical protein